MITSSARGAVIEVRLVPRASRTEIAGVRDGALVVRTASPPVDNAANDALRTLLARTLRVPPSAISIVSGARARRKRLTIDGLSAEVVSARIAAALEDSPGR